MTETRPIGCAEAVEYLWHLLDGELDPRDQVALDRHLAWCLRCCGELAFARELRTMLRERAASPLPGDVQHRLERFIDTLDGPTPEEVPGR